MKHKCIYCDKPYERSMYVHVEWQRGRVAEGEKRKALRVTVMCRKDCKA